MVISSFFTVIVQAVCPRRVSESEKKTPPVFTPAGFVSLSFLLSGTFEY
jgi:hypothetical protein